MTEKNRSFKQTAMMPVLGGFGGGSGGNVDLTGVVKSVNGVAPDENGNVTVEIPAVPENVSAFTNDAGYQTAADVEGIVAQALQDLPAGGGSGEWVTLVSETITEPVTQYRRTLTDDEQSKIPHAKKVILKMKAPAPAAYALTGVSVLAWRNYTTYFQACKNATLKEGSGNQFAVCIADLSVAGWEQRFMADGTTGISQGSAFSLSPILFSSDFMKYDMQIRGDTTTEDGFPAGTTFSLEVLM